MKILSTENVRYCIESIRGEKMDEVACGISGRVMPLNRMTKTSDGVWVDYELYWKTAQIVKNGQVSFEDIELSLRAGITQRSLIDTLITYIRKYAVSLGKPENEVLFEYMDVEQTYSTKTFNKVPSAMSWQEYGKVVRWGIATLKTYKLDNVALKDVGGRKHEILRTKYTSLRKITFKGLTE